MLARQMQLPSGHRHTGQVEAGVGVPVEVVATEEVLQEATSKDCLDIEE
jgi:hypothetical protein